MTSTSRVCAGEIDWGMVHKTCCSLKLAHWPPWKKFGTTWTLLRGGRPANLSSHGTRALVRQGTETWWSRWQSSSRTLQRTTISAALRELGLHGKVTWQKWLCKRWKTPGVPKKHLKDLGKFSGLIKQRPNLNAKCQTRNHLSTEWLWDHLWLSRLIATHLEYFPSALHSLMSIQSFQQSAFTNLLTFVSPYSNAMIIISIYGVNDCYSLSQYIQNCLKKKELVKHRRSWWHWQIMLWGRFTSSLNGRFTALKGRLMGRASELVSVNL